MTDHRPLTTILSPKTSLPALSAARIQWWAIILSAYHYDVVFCPTEKQSNADGFSRLPVELDTVDKQSMTEASLFQMTQILITSETRQATAQDPILAKVLQYTQEGWPPSVSEADLQPHFNHHMNAYCGDYG